MFENGMLGRLSKPDRCLSTDQEMIPHRNEIDAHVQNFWINDEFLRLTLKAFAECMLSTHAAR